MMLKYAVSFEFETRAPLTHRGTVEAGRAKPNVSLGFRRAAEEARKALRPVNWTSVVCVLEKTDIGKPQEASEE